jgi:hypothetical protein
MQTFNRRIFLTLSLLAALAVAAAPANAHHGWAWSTSEEFTLTGTIVQAKLGNPHGEVTVETEGARWVIEVGQPWRNQRAGLTNALLNVGRVITVHGHRSAKPGERLVKAERVVIDGKSYNLYPDRKS